MIGSWYPTPGFCEACGMSSMSEPRAITGLPLPHVATHAVGIPANPRSILKPFFSRMPVRYFDVSNSWNPSSPKLKTWSTICCVATFIVSMSAATSFFSSSTRGGPGGVGVPCCPGAPPRPPRWAETATARTEVRIVVRTVLLLFMTDSPARCRFRPYVYHRDTETQRKADITPSRSRTRDSTARACVAGPPIGRTVTPLRGVAVESTRSVSLCLGGQLAGARRASSDGVAETGSGRRCVESETPPGS